MLSCSFVVDGAPVPQGSMRGYVVKGHAVLTSDNPNLGTWRQAVAYRAREAMTGQHPYEGPVQVEIQFLLARPKGHFGARGLLPSAPDLPVTKPDLDKLARAILDGMTGVVFRDDAQVWELNTSKRYCSPDQSPRCTVYAFGPSARWSGSDEPARSHPLRLDPRGR